MAVASNPLSPFLKSGSLKRTRQSCLDLDLPPDSCGAPERSISFLDLENSPQRKKSRIATADGEPICATSLLKHINKIYSPEGLAARARFCATSGALTPTDRVIAPSPAVSISRVLVNKRASAATSTAAAAAASASSSAFRSNKSARLSSVAEPSPRRPRGHADAAGAACDALTDDSDSSSGDAFDDNASDDSSQHMGIFSRHERRRKLEPSIGRTLRQSGFSLHGDTAPTFGLSDPATAAERMPRPPAANADSESVAHLMSRSERGRARRLYHKFRFASEQAALPPAAAEGETPVLFTLDNVVTIVNRALAERDEQSAAHYAEVCARMLGDAAEAAAQYNQELFSRAIVPSPSYIS
eukprot:c2631_g1_i1.p1 GENE.c2631_g1_i1~~c2631_g1_i1.p1  ORF type:complete len:357 (+),score=49.38 c2631_g1_i1:273-1343(+)